MNQLLFDTVLGSLKRAPLLSFLVVLLIALGVGASVPMMTVYHHLKSDPIPAKSDNLFFVQLDNWRKEEPFYRPDNPPNAITYQDAARLQASNIPTLKAPMYLSDTTVRISDDPSLRPVKLPTRMTASDFFPMFDVPFLYGNAWSKADEDARRQVVVISRLLSERLFGEGSSVGKQLLINSRYFTVTGVLDSWRLTPRFYDMNNPFASVEHVYLPYSLIFSNGIQPQYWRTPYTLEEPLSDQNFESIFTNSEIIFVQYWVQLDSRSQLDEYSAFLDQHVADQKTLGRFPREANNRLSSSTKWIEKSTENSQDAGGVVALLVVMLLFFAVCLINSISILLTKFLRYKNRSTILRALGASQRFVFTQYVFEVVGLAILGGLLGIVFAFFGLQAAQALYQADAAQAASGFLADQSFDAFWTLDVSMVISSMLMAVLGGLAAGIYPAWKVCSIPPSVELNSH